MALPKLGSGKRFSILAAALGRKKGKNKIRNPSALAAAIGRKKYGAARFQQLAAAGRKK